MKANPLDRKRLINCREALGITKQEAAKRMQMSQPAYLRYESGERTPSVHVIRVMADVFGTSAEYLTGTSDNPAPNSYIVRSDIEPELFHLVEMYKQADVRMQARLLAYFKKLTVENQSLI